VTWDVAIVPQVQDWLQELHQGDPATLAAVIDALDLLGRDGPGLGPPLASPLASMTMIHAGLELLRECDPGFQFSADQVERTVAMSYLRELRPAPHGTAGPRLLFAFDPGQTAVVLAAGIEADDWPTWYSDSVPVAYAAYIHYLRERAEGGNA
jgi:hypothetical protein